MKRTLACILGFLVLQACAGTPPAPQKPFELNPAPAPGAAAPSDSADRVLARANGLTIDFREIEPTLIEAYGLNVLVLFTERDLVRQKAEQLHIIVTPQDIANEQALTILNTRKRARWVNEAGENVPSTQPAEDVTPEQAKQLLQQILENSHITQAEFNIHLEINAYLRKIVEPTVQTAVTDNAVRSKFNAEYGEKAVIRYIVANDMHAMTDVLRDLGEGKDFAEVAKTRSVDPKTAATGGSMPPFSRVNNDLPAAFKSVAFSLKKGEVADPLQIGNYLYLIKLVDLIPPQHAKFEDYEPSVRKDLYDEIMAASITAEQANLTAITRANLQITDPVLREQWDERTKKITPQSQDLSEIRKQMDEERTRAEQGATTEPATQPAGPK